MKFAVAYYLLLIYSTVILQPLIPVAEDALFHCFAEAYHIATVHAKYGNDHVEKEIAGTNDNNANNNNKNTLKDDNSVRMHIAIADQTQCACVITRKTLFFIQPESFSGKIFLSVIIPPPKFS